MDAATELNKVALGHKGSTYQEYSVDSRMLGLEPAPFPASVLTPLTATTTLRARNRLSSQGREDKGSSINPPLSSSSHNDLESFRSVEHINTGSSLFRGTLFEYQTQSVLQRQLGIYTHRSAGNGDEGVDLRGKWFLPLSAAPAPEDWVRHLNVIVQCKKSTGKIGPRIVRELQGTLSYESQPTLAILASASDFTKQALVPCLKSLWPMALVVIDTELHECRKLMWNQAAEHVMHGLQIGTLRKQNNGRVVMSAGADAATGAAEGRPVLCFNGRILERLPGPLRPSEHGYVELTNSKVGGGVDKRFLRHEVQPASAPITHSVHTSLNAGTVDSTPEWDEDFLNHHPTENEQDRVNGVEYMSEDYTEYIRTLNNDNQLLVEADSEHEFSNVDWSWMEPMDKAHLADWLSVEPRSYEAEGERILHSIDLPTHMRPCTPT
ncbi:hypothetical protein DFQ27_006229 [Actinomortierella ambigua]|uniref:Restriction endonuclease type IV Mrr domain-containing protein n=1 Tax=Actinomortierella ambigua TaxID=1343610 RepID=A0A9P6PWD3_9FUNG|nr:hypothetical protein DFQ27_006229 [Actinomortierella ambigua]